MLIGVKRPLKCCVGLADTLSIKAGVADNGSDAPRTGISRF